MEARREPATQEKRYVKVAQVSDLAPGTALQIKVEGNYIGLFNLDGSFYAIDDICSHLYCNLSDGWLRENTLTCPCHDARFDVRTGKNLDWIAPGPVATFPVRIDGNDVLVGI